MGRLFDNPWILLILILVIVLVFASAKLPDMARSLGRSARVLKSEVGEMKKDGKAEEIALPEPCHGRQVAGAGNAFALEQPPAFAGQPLMPTAADYLRLAQSGRYPATAAEQANLLYIRDKIALTAAEQLAKKVQAAF